MKHLFRSSLFLLMFFGLLISNTVFAQWGTEEQIQNGPFYPPKYDRVRVFSTAEQLMSLGIAADHGIRKPGFWFEGDFSLDEQFRMQQAGISFVVVQEDMETWYAEQAVRDAGFFEATERVSGRTCNRAPEDFAIPAAFQPGSMGGYYTMSEIYALLDSLAVWYPDYVSPRTAFGSQLTHQGREMFFTKVSDNVAVDETEEPNVLYTALVHAREPAGMMSVLFYMTWLLENKESDPRATYVISRTQMYFVPLINPDGYEINRIGNPGGGGLWRKNARDNGSSTGVDLNRNFPYEWGFNDSGSSPTPESDLYRGPSAGSEPEIANLLELAIDRNFRMALNYHSFGDLLIYPWGYDFLFTPDQSNFKRASRRLVEDNGYTYGTPYQTVMYPVNGSADDWYYGEQSLKDKTFSWSPEVGTIGFWPGPSQIVPMARDNALANLYLALFATRYDHVTLLSPSSLEREGQLRVQVEGFGVQSSDGITLRLVSHHPSLVCSSEVLDVSDVPEGEIREFSLPYRVLPGLRNGQRLEYTWIAEQDGQTFEYPASAVFGAEALALHPSSDWLAAGNGIWSETDQAVYGPSTEFIAEIGRVDLRAAREAWLEFPIQFDLENGLDYALIEVSRNGADWYPICGEHTRTDRMKRTTAETRGVPLYTGQSEWLNEFVDLSDYVGQDITLRIRRVSDDAIEGRGVEIGRPVLYRVQEEDAVTETTALSVFPNPVYPNPASTNLIVCLPGSVSGMNTSSAQTVVSIRDILGRLVAQYPVQPGSNSLDVSHLPAGGYHLVWTDNDGSVQAHAISIQR